jgi:diguanylate cyclase (GGDEF)-like protein
VAIKVFVEGNGARTAMYMQQDIESSIREHNAMRDKSEHDAMTDLFNRSKLDEMKKLEYGGLDTCGVLFFDINYLKRTNDTLGHDAGDELIRLASESIRSITNRHVMAYRIGGDEMLVVAANTSREDFEQMLELWSVRLEALNAASDIKCSMAVGSAWSSEPDIDALIRAADAQMYQHKKAMKAEREN